MRASHARSPSSVGRTCQLAVVVAHHISVRRRTLPVRPPHARQVLPKVGLDDLLALRAKFIHLTCTSVGVRPSSVLQPPYYYELVPVDLHVVSITL